MISGELWYLYFPVSYLLIKKNHENAQGSAVSYSVKLVSALQHY